MSIVCPVECIRTGCPEPDFLERNSAFLLTVFAGLTGLVGVCLTYFLKSRCKNISTPCLSCDRDVLALQPSQIEIASSPAAA